MVLARIALAKLFYCVILGWRNNHFVATRHSLCYRTYFLPCHSPYVTRAAIIRLFASL
jgi:hypothetical protein